MSTATSGVAGAGRAPAVLPPEVQRALAKVSEVASLPEVTARIVDVVENPRATAHDLHEIIRSDPGLAAKILKVVNSAFYGLPAQIGSLDRAVVLLGLTAVKNLALAASLARLFKGKAISAQFAARDLWRHSLAVAVGARLLARAGGSPNADEVFVAGLVHDLGLIVAQQLFAARVQEVAERCLNEPQSFCAAERAVMGTDHQVLGGVLAERWRFPPGLRCAIAYHHDPAGLQAPLQRATALVYVADVVCCRGRLGLWLTAQTQEIRAEMLELVGLTDRELGQVVDELPQRLQEAERIFAE